ncbi:MAG: damage-inducible protein CinA [Gammaproteobacteria bacterium RIFCSPHIGHO2_12_FULL_37_14]|nr:MAG: damage-inducible protein CinA [Gammaproteobacteria bacterium RIFCSPHIGHO2_12_FULL_37_14]
MDILKKLAAEVGNELKIRKLKLVTAESCTGGGLSYWITSIPGSSDWFERGFVTYSNAAKIELLGVNSLTLETVGAVSEEVAIEMADGALRHSHADISLAITGIAGPDGGTLAKPVGSVWMAWAKHNQPTRVLGKVFSGDRQLIREKTIQFILTELISWIQG